MNGQQIHEKVLSIINHQGNTNQNHNEILPHITVRTAINKNTRDNKCWQGYIKKQNPCILLTRMLIGAATMENSMEISQKN